MQILGVIPARYASSRFPGKPLAMIDGKTMIHRVYEQAAKSKSLSRVVVATDDERIARHVKDFGGEAIITSGQHPSGTDRCAEVAQRLGFFSPSPALPEGEGGVGKVATSFDPDPSANEGSPNTSFPQRGKVGMAASSSPSFGGGWGEAASGSGPTYLINIQGDEPFIDPAQIDTLADVLQDGTTEIATLIIPVDNHEILFDTGEVKVVMNPKMEALYFSRSVIPFLKDVPEREWHLRRQYYRHVGMYAYRADVLAQLTKLPVSSLEKAESLEQLRWLEAGYKVTCAITHHDSHCIDRPEDIEKVLKLMAMQKRR